MADTQAQKILRLASAEVGYHEGKTGENWNNFQKYSPEVPGLEWSQNQSWCATFVSWLALQAGIADLYPCTASCDVGAQWFKAHGQWSEYPAVGAQVFYGKPSDLSHTGLVVNFDNTYIYTIEGNTNTSGSSQGDGVYRQKRLRSATNVIGYGYPNFENGIKTADPNPKWKKEVVMQKTVFGVDVSHYQFDSGLNLASVKKQGYDFVILKCTQGSSWFDNTYAKGLAQAKAAGFLTGVYHFLEHGNAKAQAQNLARHIGDKDLPVYIDIESSTKPNALDWIAFRSAAKKLGLNVRGKYITETYWHSIKAPSLVGPLVLWRAAYPTMKHDFGSVLYPGNNHARWNSFGGQTPTLWQFTSNGKLSGYSGGVDINAFRGNLDDMKALKLFKDYSVTDKPPTQAPVVAKPAPKPAPKPTPPAKKPLSVIVDEVIAGKWGDGAARIRKLKAAGYDPKAVQVAVNKKFS